MISSVLRSIFPTPHFSPEEQDSIIEKFTRKEFKKGEYLLSEGQTPNHYWFVESGFIRSFAIDTEGNEISTDFFTTKDVVIDWPSFFMRTSTRENIQALTDCSCWQLSFEKFQQLFHGMEAFREAGRTRLAQSYFELKRHNISLISDHARDRYLRLLEEKPNIIQNVSLKQIATYLGITDTSLSRIRNEIANNLK